MSTVLPGEFYLIRKKVIVPICRRSLILRELREFVQSKGIFLFSYATHVVVRLLISYFTIRHRPLSIQLGL